MLREALARYGIRKPLGDLQAASERTELRRTLGARQLTALGVGAIVGAGVFSVTGLVAAQYAGPATAVSFIVAALLSGIAGLAYAEMASLIPLGGSGYTYAYASMGELVAWLTAWALVLSYGIGNAALASSFSDNVAGLLGAAGMPLPPEWTTATGALDSASGVRGIVDAPALLVVGIVTVILLRPVGESASANLVLVALKVTALVAFVAIGASRVDAANYAPFFPENGAVGILGGAALIFFAFLGFDAVSTAAEETKDPQRDLPRGILGSLAIVTVLFLGVSFVLTGLVPSAELATGEPLAYALRSADLGWLAAVMNVAGIVAALSVLLVFQLATTRIFMAISRDGLLPPWLAVVSRKHQTPNRSVLVLGAVVAVCAASLPIGVLVALTNVATLFLFAVVMVAVPILRRSHPLAKRPFRMPLSPVLPVAGVLICVALTTFLAIGDGGRSVLGFGAWMGLGLMLYAAYGASRSVIANEARARGSGSAPAKKEEEASAGGLT